MPIVQSLKIISRSIDELEDWNPSWRYYHLQSTEHPQQSNVGDFFSRKQPLSEGLGVIEVKLEDHSGTVNNSIVLLPASFVSTASS